MSDYIHILKDCWSQLLRDTLKCLKNIELKRVIGFMLPFLTATDNTAAIFTSTSIYCFTDLSLFGCVCVYSKELFVFQRHGHYSSHYFCTSASSSQVYWFYHHWSHTSPNMCPSFYIIIIMQQLTIPFSR